MAKKKSVSIAQQRSDFQTTMKQVAELLGEDVGDVTRNEYIRLSVDNNLEGRISSRKFHALGGFGTLKEKYFGRSEVSPPKILVFDIETSPILAYTWGLWDQNVGLNMIKEDWTVLSVAAKWMGDKKIHYWDTNGQDDVKDDKAVLEGIWQLLDEADVVITQNGIRFDVKKLNARFVLNNMPPPSSFRHIDTLRLSKSRFSFTSHKLEYMTAQLCKKYKKLKHGSFPGFELWAECLKKNQKAWKEMKKYNMYDVLSLEELALILLPWDKKVNFSVFEENNKCSCGSHSFKRDGYFITNSGKYKRYRCNSCGAESRGKENIMPVAKRQALFSR